MQTVTSRGSNPTNPTIQHYCLYKSSKEQMNSEQYAAFVEDPDEEWAIDVDTTPLVNISTFGWTEDGRCGFPQSSGQRYQWCPKPVASLRIPDFDQTRRKAVTIQPQRYVAKSASAGSRHTLILMIDTVPKDPDADKRVEKAPPRKTKVMSTGLNQVGLCEEKGHEEPVEVNIEFQYDKDRPISVVAGRGTSFIITEQGALYSYGYNKFGVLGHENTNLIQTPLRVAPLLRKVILKVAAGHAHTMALTDYDEVFSWGKNDKGQLGLGFESNHELKVTQVSFGNLSKFQVTDISCGHSHSLALVVTKNKFGLMESFVYAWGDESRGQLGSGDAVYRMRPQENRWLSKYLATLHVSIESIHAGGYHNLVLLKGSGQVVAWGANEYGQLGSGFQWDDPTPKIINNLRGVVHLSAGLRHNLAACESSAVEVFSWGYNGSGELGLGDTDLRLQPTHITAIKNTTVLGVSCGERHSVIVISPKPVTAKEDAALKPYFKILETAGGAKSIMHRLKHSLKKQGMDPSLIDDPDAVLPNQIGSEDKEIKNEAYAKGLRYCLDTHMDQFDWRRKALETCFECFTKTAHLKAVCLSCARNCLANYRLVPVIRARTKGDACDCRLTGNCMCLWSHVRAQFDNIIDEDKCIAPNQVRGLLKVLRAPYPVEGIDVEDCLLNLAEGQENEVTPRIAPVPFEKWYRKYFDEPLAEVVAPQKNKAPPTKGILSRSSTGLSTKSGKSFNSQSTFR